MSISKLDASRIAQYSSRHGPFTHGAPDLIGEKEKKENVSTEHVFHSFLHSHRHSHWNWTLLSTTVTTLFHWCSLEAASNTVGYGRFHGLPVIVEKTRQCFLKHFVDAAGITRIWVRNAEMAFLINLSSQQSLRKGLWFLKRGLLESAKLYSGCERSKTFASGDSPWWHDRSLPSRTPPVWMRAERSSGGTEGRKERLMQNRLRHAREKWRRVRKGRTQEEEEGRGGGARKEGRTKGGKEEGKKDGRGEERRAETQLLWNTSSNGSRGWRPYPVDTQCCGVSPGPRAQGQGQ